MEKYKADSERYNKMNYRRTGNSGLLLPELSLGLWHNFGENDDFENARNLLKCAFDNGITHFDLANNYGPPYGSAEKTFGKILKKDFKKYRDELIISSKAGYDMWEGPYGNFGSKKYLISSLDQSLQRMDLEYVDIFYHHRPDYDTPLEETMGALDLMVRQGKALYVGLSNYQPKEAEKAFKILKELGTPCLIHQPRYSLFYRWIEDGLIDLLGNSGVGTICFSPLAQGMLTDKYINGLPKDSRAVKDGRYLKTDQVMEMLPKIKALNEVAKSRNQNLAQMAISWILKDDRITSVLIGASKTEQILDSIKATENTTFSEEELARINAILA
ncbi:L-glyceraldehyde 3-phosphate reductase [Polaribacter sejongensis]|uniref:L-glyceraldehyde 3-phosphate reductase n=1 Tax=Polaribacter sejongensis TaxID=985043 RepID=A0ABM6Q1F0_9FLAO|nr:aldo/keto reductase [Polaribacter sejongensis]AUC22986.1 L-glyceraldehyde 3-phosphate reductase [Polaribacter sejongensis]